MKERLGYFLCRWTLAYSWKAIYIGAFFSPLAFEYLQCLDCQDCILHAPTAASKAGFSLKTMNLTILSPER